MKLSHILLYDLRKRSTCAHFDKSVDDQKPNCELTIRLIIWEVFRFFCNLKRKKAVWPLPFSNCNCEKKVTNNIDQFAYYGLNKVLHWKKIDIWAVGPYNHRLSSTQTVGKWFSRVPRSINYRIYRKFSKGILLYVRKVTRGIFPKITLDALLKKLCIGLTPFAICCYLQLFWPLNWCVWIAVLITRNQVLRAWF